MRDGAACLSPLRAGISMLMDTKHAYLFACGYELSMPLFDGTLVASSHPDAIGAMMALEVIASPRLAEGVAISYYHAAP